MHCHIILAVSNHKLAANMQHLPAHMLTYNLHILVCRLPHQELARGCVGNDGEMFVERGMQEAKRPVKYRVSACPEKLLVHELSRTMALQKMAQQDSVTAPPELAVRTFDQLVPKYRQDMRSGPLYDCGDEVSGTGLLGKGKPLAGEMRSAALQQFLVHLQRMPDASWPADPAVLESAALDAFTMAHKAGDEILWSMSEARSRSR